MAFTEKIRAAISAHSFEIVGRVLHVTASFGVAAFDPAGARDGAEFDRLLDCADLCLYRSKKKDRNQVTGELLIQRTRSAST